ncbi:hypothetical protein LQ567_14810 [Niabella pedocola]|uniref:Uncharacterized protein n=1 Tax=Niabella pedocola TaxID=1752077 RepID=A0ABS8PSK3_9BACT|nr:hypothetical protein [Niabella pedocola]MCD2424047.1 hypothetical protein [Niabella pedocola]
MGTTTFLGAFAAFLSSFVSFFATLFSITGTNSLTAGFFAAAFFSFAGAGVALLPDLAATFTGVFAADFDDAFTGAALTGFAGVFVVLPAGRMVAPLRAGVAFCVALLLTAGLAAAFTGVLGLLAFPLAALADFAGAFAAFPPAAFAAFAGAALVLVARAGFAAVFFFVAIVVTLFLLQSYITDVRSLQFRFRLLKLD